MKFSKRIMCVVLTILTVVLTVNFINVFATVDGDVNADGKVTVADAMLVFNHLSGKRHLTDEQIERADVNGDGKVTIADALKIYKIMLTQGSEEEREGEFKITTYGWGHGIGMSQNGANLYAKNDGMTYTEILEHYYPGTVLVETDENAPETVKYKGKEYKMRDYLAAALYQEMGPSFETEALKAQCVAIYTYAKYNGNFTKDFNENDHAMKNNVSLALRNDVIFDIVDEVMGQYLTYNGKVALTVYAATNAGTTAKCSDIWVQDLPYLTRVESKYDNTVSGYEKTITISEDEMKYKLENAFGIKLSDNAENWIQIISHDEAVSEDIGYALSVSIDGQKQVKGARVYEVLGIRSPCYTVEYV